jgi:hypothetical protein
MILQRLPYRLPKLQDRHHARSRYDCEVPLLLQPMPRPVGASIIGPASISPGPTTNRRWKPRNPEPNTVNSTANSATIWSTSTPMIRCLLALFLALSAAAQTSALHWYKGNTHTHTFTSDGDSLPDEVARWYVEHGYDFLVLSDHNATNNVDPLNALFGADNRFLVISGEEVTSTLRDPAGNKAIHVNAINVSRPITAANGSSVSEILQKNIEAVLAVHAVAQINHPNWHWSLTIADIAAAKGAQLIEIANQHPDVNNAGAGPSYPSTEQIWDDLLSRGIRLWGVASDDVHVLKNPWAAGAPLPGRGWIVVRASRLATDEIVKAIASGDFYASTGPALRAYEANSRQVQIQVRPRADRKYRIQFVGRNGRTLAESTGIEAVYECRGDEGYVRARIIDSDGEVAWTQPVFLKAPGAN